LNFSLSYPPPPRNRLIAPSDTLGHSATLSYTFFIYLKNIGVGTSSLLLASVFIKLQMFLTISRL
jgi:hypothetical protein